MPGCDIADMPLTRHEREVAAGNPSDVHPPTDRPDAAPARPVRAPRKSVLHTASGHFGRFGNIAGAAPDHRRFDVTDAGIVVRPALETSGEINVFRYERLGVAITATVDLPDDGPRTWCMISRPAGGA